MSMTAPGDSTRPTASAASADATEAGADAEPPQWLAVDIAVVAGPAWSAIPDVEPLVEAAAAALAAHAAFAAEPRCLAAIALATDADVQNLNRQFRALDKPTNVLSFPVPPGSYADAAAKVALLGDVIIAAETVLTEARAQAIPPAHHLQHLVVHGLLHLIGFDHEDDADAEVMANLETEILARLGIADPYAMSC